MLLSYVNYITEMLVPTQNLAQFKKKSLPGDWKNRQKSKAINQKDTGILIIN